MGVRYIGVASEATYGAGWAGAPTQYMDVVSESIVPDHGMIDIETAGYRERRLRVPGPYSLGGDIELIGNVDDLGTALYLTLGNLTGGIGASAYRHYITPSQTLPFWRMEIAPAVQQAAVYMARQCVGGISTALSLEAIAREALSATWSVALQKDNLANATTAAPGFSTIRPLIFYEGAVTFGALGAVANVEAFRCTIENDVDTDATVLGSRYLPGVRTQGITVSGEMDISFENWTMYQWVYAGAAAGTTPTTAIASNALTLTMTGTATGDGTPGYANYSLTLKCPQVYLDTAEANFDRRERIVEGITWNAVFDPNEVLDTVTGLIVGVTVINGFNIAAL